jgi:uncharacterized Tic20 family protein
MSDAEARNQAKLAHILNGIFPLLGGLIFWLMGKDRSAYVDDQGKEATNFGILLVAGQIAGWIVYSILSVITLGIGALIFWLLPLAVWVWGVIQGFKGGSAAEKGEMFRYSWNPLRLIK